jgi:hypothetical protein
MGPDAGTLLRRIMPSLTFGVMVFFGGLGVDFALWHEPGFVMCPEGEGNGVIIVSNATGRVYRVDLGMQVVAFHLADLKALDADHALRPGSLKTAQVKEVP